MSFLNLIGCDLDKGWQITCANKGMGGISELYLIYNDYLSVNDFDSNEKITSVSYSSGTKFYKFELINQVANYEDEQIEDEKSGLIYWKQNLSFQLGMNFAEARKQLLQIVNTRNLYKAVIKDNNLKYWLIGYENGLKVSAKMVTGKEYGNFNGELFSLTGFEKKPMYEISGGTIQYFGQYITTSGNGGSIPSEPAES